MVPVLIAGLLAMVSAIVIGPKFIERLRARDLGQQIREEGPATHRVKQGTPTMGGVLILGSALIPFLLLSQYTYEGLTVLFVTVGCAGDRLRGRLPEGAAPSLPGSPGALEDGRSWPSSPSEPRSSCARRPASTPRSTSRCSAGTSS